MAPRVGGYGGPLNNQAAAFSSGAKSRIEIY